MPTVQTGNVAGGTTRGCIDLEERLMILCSVETIF